MNKEVISDKQGISLVIMFIVGTSIIIVTGLDAKQDVWLSNLLALFATIPLVLMYARLHHNFPGKNFFDILEICFGKYIGKLVTLTYAWFAFHLSSLIARDFGEFFITVAAPQTPMLLPIIIICILGAWIVKEGIEIIGRFAEFFVLVIIITLITSWILLIPQMNVDNIKPVLYNGISPVLKGAFSTFSFPFAETVIFTMSFSSFRTSKSPYKIYTVGLLLGSFIIIINSICNILVLSADISLDVYFPLYATVSKLNIGEFLQRLQVLIAFAFLLGGFIKMSICLLAACRGIVKVFGYSDYRFIVIPLSLLLIGFSYLIFDSIMDFLDWSMKVWPLYALPFQLLIPTLVFVIAEIKSRRKCFNKNKS